MKIELTPQQCEDKEVFRAFVDEEIVPHADRYDQEEKTPAKLIEKLAQKGYLGIILPPEYEGGGKDMITCALLAEEIGRGSSSIGSLLTVHGMVSHSILRWGTKQQKEHWLPLMAQGKIIGAFGLTEPQIGSDAKNIATSATVTEDSYILNGKKKWISYGQVADLFLIFAQCEGKLSAFLVEKDAPGLSVLPIKGISGNKASMLAELHMQECLIPKENLIAGIGFGFSYVASSALDLGRYTVACNCVGISQACLDACIKYTSERKQFDVLLKEHQLIRRMITNMMANTRAARLLCYQAGYLKDSRNLESIMATTIAKYFASTTANQIAADTVQIHGANGCITTGPVQRYFRDASIMEIIEGSTQIQQINIARYGYQGYLV